jgi:AcrR family transcriptional regulator
LSLRERRKQERREAILTAAEGIFSEFGFSRTTMDEIANKADVGVATVYKYFGTKAGILEEIIRPDLEKSYAEVEEIIVDPPEDPGVAMSELIDKYRYLRNDWSSRKLLRDVSGLGFEKEEVLVGLEREADSRVQSQIRDLLLVLRGRGTIDLKLNLEDATAIIFSVFNQHYVTFITHEEIDTDKMFNDLRRRIRLLFSDWKKDSI